MVAKQGKSKDFKRKITHKEYTFMSEEAKNMGIINEIKKEITHSDILNLTKRTGNKKTEAIYHADDRFMCLQVDKKSLPIMFGGFCLFLAVGFTIILTTATDDTASGLGYKITTLLLYIGFLFFFIYYFSMPSKEHIYDRLNSLTTFPGFMWHKNITMPIKKIAFNYSQPSAQGIGSYELRIVRPDKMYSQFIGVSFGQEYYKDLSFFLWYMDKNRPLPPGAAFDEFRDRDFERRKAEGFPKPLFPSRFETPEATDKQPAERLMIGGW